MGGTGCVQRDWRRAQCVILGTATARWGTADAEMNVPSAENPELSQVSTVKPGVDQNIASHALPAAMNYIFEFLPLWLVKFLFCPILFNRKVKRNVKPTVNSKSHFTFDLMTCVWP